MISIEDACRTYGVDSETIERWILQDGVDYRYIWQGENKTRMIPRNWLIQRTAGEGLTPELIDEETFGAANIEKAILDPSQGEKRAFEMMQQVVSLHEYQEKRIAKNNKFYGFIFVIAVIVMGVGVFYTLWENNTSVILSNRLSQFSQRENIEKERSQLQTQVVQLQGLLNLQDVKKEELANMLQDQRRITTELIKKEQALRFQIEGMQLHTKNKELLQVNWKTSEQAKGLSEERQKLADALLIEQQKAIELDKKQLDLTHQLSTAHLQQEVLELKATLSKSKTKLEHRDQQIRNLQLMIGK